MSAPYTETLYVDNQREMIRIEHGRITFDKDLTLDEAKDLIACIIEQWVLPISGEDGNQEVGLETATLSLSALQDGPSVVA